MQKIMRSTAFQYLTAIILAVITSTADNPALNQFAETISSSFVFIFKWCSIPMISLAILSAASGLKNHTELVVLGRSIFKYTILTTSIAATIALILFLSINPTNPKLATLSHTFATKNPKDIFGVLLIGTMLAAIFFSVIILRCQSVTKDRFNLFFATWYHRLMSALQLVIKLMPIAIWAFVTLFIQEVNDLVATSLFLYMLCIVLANLIQALIVLPIFLRKKKIPVTELLKNMWPAIGVAFWSKSSGVALPIAINCALERAKLNEKVAKFSLPICTTINMNACSGFILITVLFVSTSYGMSYTPLQYLAWIVIATLAAIGNASVPMGCFTMSLALLAFLNTPLHVMGLILPFYALLDMLESAINIWSDSCVTAIVSKELEFNKKLASKLDLLPDNN